jgi:hypothetical protein
MDFYSNVSAHEINFVGSSTINIVIRYEYINQ